MTYRKVTIKQPLQIKLPILRSYKARGFSMILVDSNGHKHYFDVFGNYIKGVK